MLQIADFLALGVYLAGNLGVQFLTFFPLLLQFGMAFLLLRLDCGELCAAFLGIGREGFFLGEVGVDLAHHVGTGQGDRRKIVQIARHLVRVVAVEQQLQ